MYSITHDILTYLYSLSMWGTFCNLKFMRKCRNIMIYVLTLSLNSIFIWLLQFEANFYIVLQTLWLEQTRMQVKIAVLYVLVGLFSY